MAYTTLGWGVRLNLDVWVHKQYPAENRTEFQAVVSLVDVNGNWPYSYNGSSWSVRSPNATVHRSGSISSYDFRNYGSLEISRAIISFNHNADGTFTARQWTAHFSDGGPIGSGSVAIASVGAPTIARATTPTLSGGGGFTTGVSRQIQLLRAASGFTHDVTWKVGSKSGTIATGAGTSATWNTSNGLVDALATEFPNSATGTATITVVTKSGTTTIGTRYQNFTLTPAQTVAPNVSGVLWDDDNPTVKTNIGGFVQGMSLVKGSVQSVGRHGASIASSRLTVAGVLQPENTPFQVPNAGTVVASGESTDTRGLTASVAANFTVLPYEAPKLGANGWQVRRANASNVADPEGQYLRIDLHAIVKSLTVGSEKNALKVKVITRATDGPPVERNSFTYGSLTHNTAFQVSDGAQFLLLKSYEVTVEVTDNAGGKLTLTDLVTTSAATLDMNGTSVGVGKMHERGGLDVQGDIYSSSGFRVREGASKETTYSLSKITTPYGLMGYGFRGTTAQRTALGSSGDAVTGAVFFDTNTNQEYLWTGSTWVMRGYNYLQTIKFDSVGSFTFSKASYPGLRAMKVRLVGGGGSGGGSGAASDGNSTLGAGGGGGGYAESFITDLSTVPSSVSITVGAGGARTYSTGTTGGTTSFGSLVVAKGGTGGLSKSNDPYAPYVSGGLGGKGISGQVRIGGQGGGAGASHGSLATGGNGGSSQLGGGGRASGTGAGSSGQEGHTGEDYGGGGGGAMTNGGGSARYGGQGGRGVVLIDLYM